MLDYDKPSLCLILWLFKCGVTFKEDCDLNTSATRPTQDYNVTRRAMHADQSPVQ